MVFNLWRVLPPADALSPITSDNTCGPCITASAGTELDATYSLNTVISSSSRKGVYNSWTFIPHAVLLCQAFAHCRRFPTAASRRSFDRVSVQMWLIILADQRLIEALVRSYRTNKLIRNKLILKRLFMYHAIITLCIYCIDKVILNCISQIKIT